MGELINYEAVHQQIVEATTVEEIIPIRDMLAEQIRMFRNDEERRIKANALHIEAVRRLGELSLKLPKHAGRPSNNSPPDAANFNGKQAVLEKAGINSQTASEAERLSKLPADVVEKAKEAGKPVRKILGENKPKPVTRPATPEELKKAGASPTSRRVVDTKTNEVISNVEGIKRNAAGKALDEANARIEELQNTIEKWKADCEALQRGQLMKLSVDALVMRKALKVKQEERVSNETEVDEKTKEHYERRIKQLEGALRNANAKVAAFMSNGQTILSNEERKAIMVCLHPDTAGDANEKARRERAFKLFTNAIKEIV